MRTGYCVHLMCLFLVFVENETVLYHGIVLEGCETINLKSGLKLTQKRKIIDETRKTDSNVACFP